MKVPHCPLRPQPGNREIGGRQRVLRGLSRRLLGARRSDRGSFLVHPLVQELGEHFCGGSGLVPELNDRLRADRTGLRLTRAELAHI